MCIKFKVFCFRFVLSMHSFVTDGCNVNVQSSCASAALECEEKDFRELHRMRVRGEPAREDEDKRHRMENSGKKEKVGCRVEKTHGCQTLGKSMANNKRWREQSKIGQRNRTPDSH